MLNKAGLDFAAVAEKPIKDVITILIHSHGGTAADPPQRPKLVLIAGGKSTSPLPEPPE
jgi:hypothetical protein